MWRASDGSQLDMQLEWVSIIDMAKCSSFPSAVQYERLLMALLLVYLQPTFHH